METSVVDLKQGFPNNLINLSFCSPFFLSKHKEVFNMETETSMPNYDDFNEYSGSEFLIPARENDKPVQEYRIEKLENRKTVAGKEFPVMTLKNKDGGILQIPAWVRDVAPLCKDWGTNPKDWIGKNVNFSISNKKGILVPVADIIDVEEVN